MISVDKAREILGEKGKKYSDKEIEEIRDGLRNLVEVIIDDYLSKDKEKTKKL